MIGDTHQCWCSTGNHQAIKEDELSYVIGKEAATQKKIEKAWSQDFWIQWDQTDQIRQNLGRQDTLGPVSLAMSHMSHVIWLWHIFRSHWRFELKCTKYCYQSRCTANLDFCGSCGWPYRDLPTLRQRAAFCSLWDAMPSWQEFWRRRCAADGICYDSGRLLRDANVTFLVETGEGLAAL